MFMCDFFILLFYYSERNRKKKKKKNQYSKRHPKLKSYVKLSMYMDSVR